MKFFILAVTVGVATAFAPKQSCSKYGRFSLIMSQWDEYQQQDMYTEESDPYADGMYAQEMGQSEQYVDGYTVVTPINGWVPDANLPCYGLPGAIPPLGFFDPMGFSENMSVEGVKRLREAEVMHGRVAMMACVGFIIGESTPTIAYGFTIPHTIAINQVPEIPGTVLFPFFLIINILEALRASVGWVEPGLGPLFTLRDSYYPGDIGFDPLDLKPKTKESFDIRQTKELSNGRLAMIGAAGMCVQELVNGKGILETLGF
jgi:hypothetical protein